MNNIKGIYIIFPRNVNHIIVAVNILKGRKGCYDVKRKQYLIDKKLQLGMTFAILGVALIASALIIPGMSFSVVYNNEKIGDVLKIQEHIVQFLKTRVSLVENDIYKKGD